GADLIIGHHPHVPQPWEEYRGRYIFYSLGDFYFDSTDGKRYPCRDWGFMVLIFFSERQISHIQALPFERVSDRVVPLGAQRNPVTHVEYLRSLAKIVSSSDFEGYWQELAVDLFAGFQPFL